MRLLTRLLTVATTTATAVALVAAPASATPAPCPGGEPICLYFDAITVPVGTPTISPTGLILNPIPGPQVCDSSGTNCHPSYILLPGAVVSASGLTLATITVPGFGIGINGTSSTVYFSAPFVSGGSGSLGITVKVLVPVSPFYLDGTSPDCIAYHDILVGTITTARMCTLVVTIGV